jgi:hypothetical protein
MGRTWLNWILLRYLDLGSYKLQPTRREVRYETQLIVPLQRLNPSKIPEP